MTRVPATAAGIAVLLLLLAMPAAAQYANQPEPPTKALNADERGLIENEAMGGNGEVVLGNMAAMKAGSEDVKKFGARMVADHGKADDTLRSVANKYDMPIPLGEMPDAMKFVKAKLDQLSGAQFDKVYVPFMVKEHEQDLRELHDALGKTKNPDLKNWIVTNLPVIQSHLDQAKQIEQKMGATGK